jgi:endonuclease/exonuclease/phosphatase family metal-dependent hydrolase
MAPWRVATYNIRHGQGRDGRVDLARTAAEIAALRADVVGPTKNRKIK